MNKKTIEILEEDLHAYVDHQLSEEKVKAVEELMRNDPEVALQVQEWQQQNMAIIDHFDSNYSNEIPEKLTIKNIKSKQELKQENKDSHKQPWFYAMAASFLMVASGSIGWFAHSISQPTQKNVLGFVNSAISAHQVFAVEVRHPVEVGPDEQDHLVAWLSKRVDHPLKLPELEKFGYKLLGGRLLSMQKGKPAAQFMFEDKEGQRITWMISKNPAYSDHALLSKNEDSVNSFYWMDSNVAYSVTGQIDPKKLRELSLGIYRQINERPFNQMTSL